LLRPRWGHTGPVALIRYFAGQRASQQFLLYAFYARDGIYAAFSSHVSVKYLRYQEL